MDLLPNLITEPAGWIGAAAQTALEVARFGGLQTDEEPAPYEVFADRQIFRLRRYYGPGEGSTRADVPAVMLIPPMMIAAEIYDVSP
jgi:putative long chain acyl-CoA synthase